MTSEVLADRLDAVEAVREVRAALAGEVEAWLVGGVVRDALLGRPLIDIDLAVAGDSGDAARRLSRRLSAHCFPLSDEFGVWRVLDEGSGVGCDVSPLQGSTIEQDLGRRDFTVNAMAVELQSGREAIDPHGGLRDLRDGVLRVLGGQAYADDPLRALRLPRLAAELSMVPDEETERLTRAVAPRLSEPSSERVFVELRRLLLAPGVIEGLELAERLGVLAVVLPELTGLRGVEQSDYHHLDVWGHTLEVVARQRALLAPGGLEDVFGPRAAEVRSVLEEPLGDGLTRGEGLLFGALLHDIGKPATRDVREDGRVTFVGHDRTGEEMARSLLRRLRTSDRLRSYVAALTRSHLRIGFLVHERPLDRHAEYRYLRGCDPVGVEVSVLSCADRLATRGRKADAAIAAHIEVAREMIGPALAWRAIGGPAPPVTGGDLTAELGIPPGPEIGELLEALREAAYADGLSDREKALALARALHRGSAEG